MWVGDVAIDCTIHLVGEVVMKHIHTNVPYVVSVGLS